MIYWFTVGVRVQLTYSTKEKMKDITPVHSIHTRALLPRISLIGSEMLGIFTISRDTIASLYSFHHIALYSSWYTQKKELIRTQNTTRNTSSTVN